MQRHAHGVGFSVPSLFYHQVLLPRGGDFSPEEGPPEAEWEGKAMTVDCWIPNWYLAATAIVNLLDFIVPVDSRNFFFSFLLFFYGLRADLVNLTSP